MENLISYMAALNEIRGTDPIEDGEWVQRWKAAYQAIKSEQEVSIHKAMALIHPRFFPGGRKEPDFDGAATAPCQIGNLVPGLRCLSEGEPAEFHKDHVWPRALGGTTDERNRTDLCSKCNRLKTFNPSFWFYNFDGQIPEWVSDLIEHTAAQIRGAYSDHWVGPRDEMD